MGRNFFRNGYYERQITAENCSKQVCTEVCDGQWIATWNNPQQCVGLLREECESICEIQTVTQKIPINNLKMDENLKGRIGDSISLLKENEDFLFYVKILDRLLDETEYTLKIVGDDNSSSGVAYDENNKIKNVTFELLNESFSSLDTNVRFHINPSSVYYRERSETTNVSNPNLGNPYNTLNIPVHRETTGINNLFYFDQVLSINDTNNKSLPFTLDNLINTENSLRLSSICKEDNSDDCIIQRCTIVTELKDRNVRNPWDSSNWEKTNRVGNCDDYTCMTYSRNYGNYDSCTSTLGEHEIGIAIYGIDL